MAAAGGELLCVSGAALGAALATLFLGRQARPQDDHAMLQQQQLMRHMLMQQQPSMSAAPQLKPAATKDVANPSYTPQEAMDMCAHEAHKDLNITVAGWEGFSMEDARKRSEQFRENFKELSPPEVLCKLQRGNARFWTGNAVRPEKSAFERRALIMSQFPLTAVLGCSDSRVPVEVIFDQGLGDMFVVRVAGNLLDTSTKASLQYAVHHLKVKLLLVMGHEGCGAVKAAGLPLAKIEQEPEELAQALKMMKAGLNENRLKNVHDARAYDREAVVTNVRRQVEGLCEDSAIMAMVESKELIVIGCFYEISSGIVDFFMEVTETQAEQPAVFMRGVSPGVQSVLQYRKDHSQASTSKRGKTGFHLPKADSQPVNPC